ncbi:hypothetical protein HAL1_16936 [Halomonas sp. HAL1]|nr:hypothetical protein HAL1_16936 [Halomonas sp. HAL1]
MVEPFKNNDLEIMKNNHSIQIAMKILKINT